MPSRFRIPSRPTAARPSGLRPATAARRWFRALGPALALATLAAVGCGEAERHFDGERAFGHLVAQMEGGPRVPGSPGHASGLAKIRTHLEDAADRVSLHRFRALSPLDSTDLEMANVVAVFREESPIRILFGAHWDSRAHADMDPDEAKRTEPVPGANDGASGVAVLLELATALRDAPPSIGVDLAFFDGEDQGVDGDPETWALGSAAFVRDHPTYRPSFVVIVDMVGRRGARFRKEGNSVLGAAPLVEAVWALGRDLGLTVLEDSLGAAVMDDHIPFLRAGIPAVDIIGYGDPDWHTTSDLPENCAPETLEEIGRLLLGLVARAEASLSS